MMPIDSARVVSYSTSIVTVIVSVTILAIFDAQLWWPWSRPVQGSSRSSMIKVHRANRKPIDGFLSDLFESKLVSVFIFEIFDKSVL